MEKGKKGKEGKKRGERGGREGGKRRERETETEKGSFGKANFWLALHQALVSVVVRGLHTRGTWDWSSLCRRTKSKRTDTQVTICSSWGRCAYNSKFKKKRNENTHICGGCAQLCMYFLSFLINF